MAFLLEQYRAFIIDLDGVVYLLDRPIPGSREVIDRLQSSDFPLVFLTNNSVATPQEYVKKLQKLGIEANRGQIVTSSQALGEYLDANYETRGRKAFVIGEGGLVSEVEVRGLELLSSGNAMSSDFVFVGWDRRFDFKKLKAAVTAIRNGAHFIATNTDATYPTPEGLWPGAGTIVAAVSTGAGREPLVVGKPNPLIVNIALKRMGALSGETLLIGDRLDTDIKAGALAGVDTMLVLTGVSKVEEVEHFDFQPTHIGSSIEALLGL